MKEGYFRNNELMEELTSVGGFHRESCRKRCGSPAGKGGAARQEREKKKKAICSRAGA